MLELRTTREVAEALGVPETLIENTIRRREIARPQVVGHVRLWSAEEVEALRAALAARATRRAARCAAWPAGRAAGQAVRS